MQVTVDLANAQSFTLDTAYGYTASGVLSVPLGIARTTCPVTFNLAAASGVVVSGQTGE